MVDLDPRIGNCCLDANALDAAGTADGAEVDELLRQYWESDDFRLQVPCSVRQEIKHPHTPAGVKRNMSPFIYSEDVELTDDESARRDRIRGILQGNSKPGRHHQDADHLFWSQRYGGRHFITHDRRLLKKAEEIFEALTIKVLQPGDFLEALEPHRKRRSW